MKGENPSKRPDVDIHDSDTRSQDNIIMHDLFFRAINAAVRDHKIAANSLTPEELAERRIFPAMN